ncbi:cache domain-containing protein [Methyloraptor flagellatus]|uniref:Cache domain-containing protein n=1 Tax=Methyloraptor flagellatus TaxID=3162530 RepID=A0AAU7XEM9_9HYPH
MRRLSISASVGLAAAAVIAATLGVMLHLVFGTTEEVMRRDREAQMRSVGQALGQALDQAGRFALAQAETMVRRQAVQAALAKGDRAELLRLSVGTYDYLRNQTGVTVFGYHTPDLRYFLRVHRPDDAIDDISKARPMVLAANKTRRSQMGLEIGVTGIVSMRGIAVVQAGDAFLGTMEVGLDPEPIIQQVKTVTNADVAVVLGQSLAGLSGAGKGRGGGEVIGDLVISDSTDDARFAALARAGTIRLAREAEVREIRQDGVASTMLIQPLVDFSGRMVGDLVAVKSFPDQRALSQQVRTELTVTALVGGILAFVLFTILAGLRARPETEA